MASKNLSRRAALAKQQELEERQRRNRRILGAALGAIALVVVGILAFVIIQQVGRNSVEPIKEQQTPPNATDTGGITLGSTGTQAAADAPHVVIYEDFQCPGCAYYEQTYGPVFEQLVDEGKITVEYHMAHFLDRMINNDASYRAANAAAAADSVGKFREYHKLVFANQPEEGKGYTDKQLRDEWSEAAGIQGDDLKKFKGLYDGRAFNDFVKKADQSFQDSGFTSTPTYAVNGKKLQFVDEQGQNVLIPPDADSVLKAIQELGK